jgi:hypothetical protein
MNGRVAFVILFLPDDFASYFHVSGRFWAWELDLLFIKFFGEKLKKI